MKNGAKYPKALQAMMKIQNQTFRNLYAETMYDTLTDNGFCSGSHRLIPSGSTLAVRDTHKFRVLCATQYEGKEYFGWFDLDALMDVATWRASYPNN